jgi:hypothetical protein
VDALLFGAHLARLQRLYAWHFCLRVCFAAAAMRRRWAAPASGSLRGDNRQILVGGLPAVQYIFRKDLIPK